MKIESKGRSNKDVMCDIGLITVVIVSVVLAWFGFTSGDVYGYISGGLMSVLLLIGAVSEYRLRFSRRMENLPQ